MTQRFDTVHTVVVAIAMAKLLVLFHPCKAASSHHACKFLLRLLYTSGKKGLCLEVDDADLFILMQHTYYMKYN